METPPSHKEKACGYGLSPAPDLGPGLPELWSPDRLEVILKDTDLRSLYLHFFGVSEDAAGRTGSDRQQQLEHPAGT